MHSFSEVLLTDGDDVSKSDRKRKRMLSWQFERTCRGKEEALFYVQSEGTWAKSYTNRSNEGIKVHYRCNKIISCPAAIHLHYYQGGWENELKGAVAVFRNSEPHDHNAHFDWAGRGIPRRSQDLVLNLLEAGISRTNDILKAFDGSGLAPPDRSQLYKFVRYYRKSKQMNH